MSEQAIEKEIQAKGLNAPRLNPEHIDATITSEFYFTAADGVEGASGHRPNSVRAGTALGLLTFCVLVLRNGFTVTGESACASPENFDADIGRSIAYKNAREKIWALEGYLLKEKLWSKGAPVGECASLCEANDGIEMHPYQQRVIDEKSELDKRINALLDFVTNRHVFLTLDKDEQDRMLKQGRLMEQLSEVLGQRIEAF